MIYIMGNNPVGHFFSEAGQADLKAFEGLTSAVGDTLSGITSGNFDYSNTKSDFINYGRHTANAFGSNYSNYKTPLSADAQQMADQKAAYNAAINPLSSWNKVNWETASSKAVNSVYGSSVGNDNVKPSDLLKISNPMAKMAIAQSRGMSRQTVMGVAGKIDVDSVPMLAGNSSASSDNTNSAGGEGPATSADVGQNSMKQPNTTPIGTTQAAVDTPSHSKDVQAAPTNDVVT
jgi:hypothetical protein